MTPSRRTALAALLAVSCAWPLSAVQASDKYPSKIVRIVVPSPPGGSNDFVARLLSQKLQELWSQTVIVEYKPGAAQIIGTDFVAKSAPDGYTIGMMLNSHLINAHVRKNLPYDTLGDFTGVMLLGYQPLMITTATSSPYQTIADVIAAAKKSPGSVTYATPGAGSPMHFTGEFLGKSFNTELLHVPFKGGAQQMQDVLAGRVSLNIASLGTSQPFIQSGKLRPLAVLEPKRLPGMPDVPTLAESIPGYSAQSFIGFMVPRGTPKEVVQTINEGLKAVLKLPDVVAAMNKQGLTIVASNPEALDSYLKTELDRWGQLIRKTGFTPE